MARKRTLPHRYRCWCLISADRKQFVPMHSRTRREARTLAEGLIGGRTVTELCAAGWSLERSYLLSPYDIREMRTLRMMALAIRRWTGCISRNMPGGAHLNEACRLAKKWIEGV